MTYCVSCGQALAQAASFCTNCGAKALPSEAVSSVSSVSRSSTVPAPILHASAAARTAVSRTLFVLPTGFVRPFSALMDKHLASPLALVADDNHVQLQSKVRLALKRLLATGEVKYVCVLGNWADVPVFRVPNPCGRCLEDDPFCSTDALYGCVEPFDSEDEEFIFSLLEAVPVGRIPSLDPDVVARALLETPVALDPAQAFAFGVTAECWSLPTRAIVRLFTDTEAKANLVEEPQSRALAAPGVLASPGWDADDLQHAVSQASMEPGAVLLFNVHGSPDETGWFGQAGGPCEPRIMTPDTIQQFNSALLISEACYGGALGYDEPSIVEQFFANGGKAFVGCSVIAWGTTNKYWGGDECLSGADLIALHFLKGLRQGLEFGGALKHAKTEVMCGDPGSDDIARKSVMSFNLFGAPWHAMQAAAMASVRPVRPEKTSLLDRVRSGRAGGGESPTAALDAIRQRYRSRLPADYRRFFARQDEVLSQVTQFKDIDKIETFLSDMQIMMDDCELETLDFGDELFYRLSGKTQNKSIGPQLFMLVTDKHGQLIKTLTTKGTS